MSHLYILSFVSLLVLFNDVHSAGLADNPGCIEKGLVIEAKLKSLLFVDDSFKKFDEIADVKPYCEQAKALLLDMKNYKKTQCLTRLARQVVSTIIPKFGKFVKLRCSDAGYEETLELAKCTGVENRPQVNRCFQDYSSIIRHTAYKVNDSTRVLNLLCCNYHRVINCLSPGNVKDCGKINSGRYARDIIQEFIGDLFSLLCAQFTPAHCQAVGLTDELNKIKIKRKIDREFIIIPALRVADKLTDY